MQTTETITLNNIQAYTLSTPSEIDLVIDALQELKGLREAVANRIQKPLFGREEVLKAQPAAPSKPGMKAPSAPRPLRRNRRSVPRPGSCREIVYTLLAQGVCERRAIIPRLAAARQVSLEQAEGLADTVLSNPRDPYIRRIAMGVYKVLQPERFLPKVVPAPESVAADATTAEPMQEAQAA